MFDLTISGQGLLFAFAGLAVLVIGIIFFARRMMAQNTKNAAAISTSNTLKERNKYASVDAFRWRGTFLKTGFAIALLATIFAFSWTQYEAKVYIPEAEDIVMEDMVIIPRTKDLPKPPPPPPPPPTIIEIPDEVIEDTITFVDTSIDEETVVTVAPKVDKTPPPPPLPPVIKEKKIAEIFKIVEEMPRFISDGCEGLNKQERKQCAEMEMLKFIYKNIKYPRIAQENGIHGTVVIRFMIDTDGQLKNGEILREPGGGIGAEALRVVNLMNGKWKAGEQHKRPVKVEMNLPIRFQLE